MELQPLQWMISKRVVTSSKQTNIYSSRSYIVIYIYSIKGVFNYMTMYLENKLVIQKERKKVS